MSEWGVGNSIEGDPSLEYTAFIKSAWPLQRAWLRVIEMSYKTQHLPVPQPQVVQSAYLDMSAHYSATQALRFELSKFWRSWSQEELLDKIVLVADGKRIRPLEVKVTTSEIEYWGFMVGGSLRARFPREMDGKPILNPSMREVYLEVADPNSQVRLPFNVKKMMVRGELVY